MATYSSVQVLTVKELKVGERLHCGSTGGRCMTWTVLDKEDAVAYIRVGNGSTVKMTGKDIRAGLPMFRVVDCPICKQERVAKESKRINYKVSDNNYVVVPLLAADVRSSLSGVDNVRKKNGRNTGGAVMDTPTRRRKALAQKYVRQILSREG